MTENPMQVRGKGWSVSCVKGKKPRYYGYAVRNGHRVVDGTPTPYWPDKRDAVRYAVAHAHKAGTLDWDKTVLWLKLSGLHVTIDRLTLPKVFQRQKGWYLTPIHRYYQVRVGPLYRESLYWANGTTPYSAFSKAVDMGLMEERMFDYDSSIMWLEGHGYDDCASLLRARNVD